MKTVEAMIIEAMTPSGLEKTAGVKTQALAETVAGIEKMASAVTDTTALNLIKTATAALTKAASEIAETTAKLHQMEKMSAIRNEVDGLLQDGMITPYEVQEKIAELLAADRYLPTTSGNLGVKDMEKTAGSGPQKREMFDGAI